MRIKSFAHSHFAKMEQTAKLILPSSFRITHYTFFGFYNLFLSLFFCESSSLIRARFGLITINMQIRKWCKWIGASALQISRQNRKLPFDVKFMKWNTNFYRVPAANSFSPIFLPFIIAIVYFFDFGDSSLYGVFDAVCFERENTQKEDINERSYVCEWVCDWHKYLIFGWNRTYLMTWNRERRPIQTQNRLIAINSAICLWHPWITFNFVFDLNAKMRHSEYLRCSQKVVFFTVVYCMFLLLLRLSHVDETVRFDTWFKITFAHSTQYKVKWKCKNHRK